MLLIFQQWSVPESERDRFHQARLDARVASRQGAGRGCVAGWVTSEQVTGVSLWNDPPVASGRPDVEVIQQSEWLCLQDLEGIYDSPSRALSSANALRIVQSRVEETSREDFVRHQRDRRNPHLGRMPGMLAGAFLASESHEPAFLEVTFWQFTKQLELAAEVDSEQGGEGTTERLVIEVPLTRRWTAEAPGLDRPPKSRR